MYYNLGEDYCSHKLKEEQYTDNPCVREYIIYIGIKLLEWAAEVYLPQRLPILFTMQDCLKALGSLLQKFGSGQALVLSYEVYGRVC